MPKLKIILEIPSFTKEDIIIEDPDILAPYFLDPTCDDPTFEFDSAQWVDE